MADSLLNEVMASALARFQALVRPATDRPQQWREACKQARGGLPPTLAVKLCRSAHASHPNDPVLMIHFADVLILLGDVGQAAPLISLAQAKRPQSKPAMIARAKLEARQGRLEAARQCWESALDTFPEDHGILRRLAQTCIDLGDRKTAIDALEKVCRRAAASPTDHYLLAELRASLSGHWISLDQSREIFEKFAADPKLTARHLRRLQLAGEIIAATELESGLQDAAESPPAAQLLEQAQSLETTRDFEGAAGAYIEAFAQTPSDLNAAAKASACLSRAGRHGEAASVMDAVGRGEACDLLLRAQAEAALAAGDGPRAVRHQSSAMRLCPSLENAAGLCRILLACGRLAMGRRVRQEIEATFGSTHVAFLELGKLALEGKEPSQALAWLDKAWQGAAHPRPLLRLLTNVLWEVGDVEGASLAMLSYATDRPQVFAARKVRGAQCLEGLQSQVRHLQEELETCEDYDSYLRIAKTLRRIVTTPNLLKADASIDRHTGAFLRELTQLESQGQLEQAATLIDGNIDLVIARTTVPVRAGNLLFRAARLNAKLGRLGTSANFLERAIWMNKEDPVLISVFARLLRTHQTCIKLADPCLTPVLIHTWQGNVKRARMLARQLHQETGVTVLTFQGDPSLEMVAVERQAYGHDLLMPCDNNYLTVTRKLMLVYRYLYTCTNVAGVFKVDDDNAVWDFERFKELHHFFVSSREDYIGKVALYNNGVYHHGRAGQAKTHPPTRRACTDRVLQRRLRLLPLQARSQDHFRARIDPLFVRET